MTKVYQGELPKNINVVVDGKVLAVARFNGEGIYETDNKEVLAELKRYGYEVETVKPVKEVKEPQKSEKDPEAKPKAKPNKKKDVK